MPSVNAFAAFLTSSQPPEMALIHTAKACLESLATAPLSLVVVDGSAACRTSFRYWPPGFAAPEDVPRTPEDVREQ
jgi:hypothetical protein